jgi:hypothetical protein
MARPIKEIDWTEFEKLCFIQCSLREICEWFHITDKTLQRRCKEHYGEGFSEVFAKKRVGGLISLRRNLFKQSEHNPAVAIFLAKNWLGMKDRQEIEQVGDANKPIGVKMLNFDAKEVARAILEAERLGLPAESFTVPDEGAAPVNLPARSDI